MTPRPRALLHIAVLAVLAALAAAAPAAASAQTASGGDPAAPPSERRTEAPGPADERARGPRPEKPSAAPGVEPPRLAVLEEVDGTLAAVNRNAHRMTVTTAAGPVELTLDRNTLVYTARGLGTVLDLVPGAALRAGRDADHVAYWVQVRAPQTAAPPASAGTVPGGGGAPPAEGGPGSGATPGSGGGPPGTAPGGTTPPPGGSTGTVGPGSATAPGGVQATSRWNGGEDTGPGAPRPGLGGLR